MAYYAFLDETGMVVDVITGQDETLDVSQDWEQFYANERGLVCKRTSINTVGGVHLLGGTPFRKNFAGVGYTYNETIDAFIPPQPYPSWILNNDVCLWESPIPYPMDVVDGVYYGWNEATQSWDVINIDSVSRV